MKVKKCPARKHCFDYKDNNCDNCDFGKEFTKLHKRIDRLKKQNETLTIQRNAWYLTAERVGEDLQKAKADVAREIFEEIERYAELNLKSLDIAEKVEPRAEVFFGGGKQAFSILLDKLAELKKKYQEGEPNGSK